MISAESPWLALSCSCTVAGPWVCDMVRLLIKMGEFAETRAGACRNATCTSSRAAALILGPECIPRAQRLEKQPRKQANTPTQAPAPNRRSINQTKPNQTKSKRQARHVAENWWVTVQIANNRAKAKAIKSDGKAEEAAAGIAELWRWWWRWCEWGWCTVDCCCCASVVAGCG